MRVCRRESRGWSSRWFSLSAKHKRDEQHRAEDHFQAWPQHDQCSDQPVGPRRGRFMLYQLLRDIDFGKVVAALKAQSIQKIATAGVFVVAGYVTLTFYDVFALRTIGRRQGPLHSRRAGELHEFHDRS